LLQNPLDMFIYMVSFAVVFLNTRNFGRHENIVGSED